MPVMSKRLFIPMIALLFCASAALADDPPPAAEPAVKWTRKIEGGIRYNDGNTETTDIRYGFELGAAGKVDWLKWTLSGVWGEDRALDGKTETKKRLGYLVKYEHLFTPKQAADINLSYLYDKFAFVDYSYILSPAYSLYLLKNDRLELATEVGPAAVWRKEDAIKNDYVTLRLAGQFKWVISDTANFTQSVEYLPELDGAEATLINFEAALLTSVTPICGLKCAITDKYNSNPADAAEKNDLSLSASLVFTL